MVDKISNAPGLGGLNLSMAPELSGARIQAAYNGLVAELSRIVEGEGRGRNRLPEITRATKDVGRGIIKSKLSEEKTGDKFEELVRRSVEGEYDLQDIEATALVSVLWRFYKGESDKFKNLLKGWLGGFISSDGVRASLETFVRGNR